MNHDMQNIGDDEQWLRILISDSTHEGLSWSIIGNNESAFMWWTMSKPSFWYLYIGLVWHLWEAIVGSVSIMQRVEAHRVSWDF